MNPSEINLCILTKICFTGLSAKITATWKCELNHTLEIVKVPKPSLTEHTVKKMRVVPLQMGTEPRVSLDTSLLFYD